MGAEAGNAELLRATLHGWLAGPTAVGKSEVALRLCEMRGLSLLSLDSRQIYRGLDIGTAKPSAEERRRVPHLLIDRLDPTEACSAGRYRELALAALSGLRASGRRALAVGGAGLYWEALTRPLHDLPRASAEIRARHEEILRREGSAGLHAELRRVDPETAARLSPNDRQRISRALEVAALAGRPLSELLRAGRPAALDLPVAVLERPPAELRERIAARAAAMLDAGLLEEIRGLIAAGVPPEAPAFRSVGYREFLPHLLRGEPLEACRARFLQATWLYARRQQTWLRGRVPGHHVVRAEAGETVDRLAARVGEALRDPRPA